MPTRTTPVPFGALQSSLHLRGAYSHYSSALQPRPLREVDVVQDDLRAA